MTHSVTRAAAYVLSRLIWLCIIFFVVVHAVHFLGSGDDSDSVQLNLLRFFNGTLGLGDFLAQYWPKEILLTIAGFALFEAITSRDTYSFALKKREKTEDGDSLEPLKFNLEIEAENSRPGLVGIEIKNDERTPMEFVAKILEEYFRFSRDDAVKLMLEIHTKGAARVQWIDADKADRIVDSISREARRRSYPLECIIHLA